MHTQPKREKHIALAPHCEFKVHPVVQFLPLPVGDVKPGWQTHVYGWFVVNAPVQIELVPQTL